MTAQDLVGILLLGILGTVCTEMIRLKHPFGIPLLGSQYTAYYLK